MREGNPGQRQRKFLHSVLCGLVAARCSGTNLGSTCEYRLVGAMSICRIIRMRACHMQLELGLCFFKRFPNYQRSFTECWEVSLFTLTWPREFNLATGSCNESGFDICRPRLDLREFDNFLPSFLATHDDDDVQDARASTRARPVGRGQVRKMPFYTNGYAVAFAANYGKASN
eukprot:6210603-Pleurochrysis_carterae.AAC.1